MDASRLAPGGHATVVLAQLARAVVHEVDPRQDALLDEVTARRPAGRAPRRPGRLGGSVGSGFVHTATAEVIYPLLSGAFSQVLGTAAVAGWRRRRWRRRAAVPLPLVRVTLERDRLEELHAACVGHGVALGLSRAKATVLADAINGQLLQAMTAHENDR